MNGTLRTGDYRQPLPLVSIAETEKSVFDSIHSWLVTVDHKKLGLMYIMYGLSFLLVAGIEALLMRIQLAFPNNHFLSPQLFNQLFTVHGTTWSFLLACHSFLGSQTTSCLS
jgi:cytochrome c oxidase subunit 1